MKPIFSGSEIIASVIMETLAQKGIEVVSRNDIQSALFAGFGTLDASVVLMVSEEDEDEAQKIIQDLNID